MNGEGTMVWHDNKKYTGSFQNDRRHGFGVITWPDGRSYEGMWAEGKQHGLGKFLKDGITKYGEWNQGIKVRWVGEHEYNEAMIYVEF